MAHIDAEDLALLALGEAAPADQASHLADCRSCAAELAQLRELVHLGRQANPVELLVPAPDHVWQSITAALRADSAPTMQASPAPAPAAAPGVVDIGSARSARASSGGRGRRYWSLLAAAAVGAILGGSAVAIMGSQGGSQPEQLFVAQAVLDPVSQQSSIHGSAVASQGADGLEIRVDARGLPAGDGFYEVWLLDSAAQKLVALGALPPGSVGSFTVPPGVSLTDFPIVDISLEPYDGDPGHSHNSLLRGTLSA